MSQWPALEALTTAKKSASSVHTGFTKTSLNRRPARHALMASQHLGQVRDPVKNAMVSTCRFILNIVMNIDLYD